ncbi:MAG: hypothetical protein GQ569_01980 [Methylococcaceae bacterium]|nr:hypothetical protein [Methylococcaceae bacterium]
MLQTIAAKLDAQGYIHWQEKPKLTGECNILVTVLDESVAFESKAKSSEQVVLSEARYQDLLEAEAEVYQNRLKASLDDVAAGKVQRFDSVNDLMNALED